MIKEVSYCTRPLLDYIPLSKYLTGREMYIFSITDKKDRVHEVQSRQGEDGSPDRLGWIVDRYRRHDKVPGRTTRFAYTPEGFLLRNTNTGLPLNSGSGVT